MTTSKAEDSGIPSRRIRNWKLKSNSMQRTDSAPSTSAQNNDVRRYNTLPSKNITNVSVPNSPSNSKNNSSNITNNKMEAGDQVICPICNTQFLSIYVLNKHVDEQHLNIFSKPQSRSIFNSDSEEDILEEAIGKTVNWTKEKYKNFIQPISKQAPNLQQLSKLVKGNHPDVVFETHLKNENSNHSSSTNLNGLQDNNIKASHYKNLNLVKNCFDKNCNKPFGLLSGKVNCKRCGEVFCEEHSDLPMKLDKNAQHDSINGMWYKVCLLCYQSKQSYNSNIIVSRNITMEFNSSRRKVVDRIQLETNLLDSRLEKLALAQINNINKNNLNRKAEQAVVNWQSDHEVKNCPYCNRVFNKLTLRKHHCRLCGKVVCGDIKCSSKIAIDSIIDKVNVNSSIKVEILACKRCGNLINKRKDTMIRNNEDTILIRYYNQLKRQKMIIQKHLPQFNSLIYTLKSKSNISEQDKEVQSAFLIRKDLLNAFSQFEAVLQSIKRYQAKLLLEERLAKAIINSSILFLQSNTISLSMLPKLLNQSKSNNKKKDIIITNSNLDNNEDELVNNLNDPNSILLRQKLEVFREQTLNLKVFIEQATRERRLDDVRNLSLNLKEVEDEIELIKNQLNNL